MSNKAPETPIDKYNRLSKELKHQRKSLKQVKLSIDKLEKSLIDVQKKLFFCPNCNKPQLIPSKNECENKILSLLDENNDFSFYDCKFAQCKNCKKIVMIEKLFIDKDD